MSLGSDDADALNVSAVTSDRFAQATGASAGAAASCHAQMLFSWRVLTTWSLACEIVLMKWPRVRTRRLPVARDERLAEDDVPHTD